MQAILHFNKFRSKGCILNSLDNPDNVKGHPHHLEYMELVLVLFSKLETKLLDLAIKAKLDLIKDLVEKSKQETTTQQTLPMKDKIALESHIKKKIAFFKQQDHSKWKNFSQKPKSCFAESKKTYNKVKNFKKRTNRRRRKLEKFVKKVLEDGSVVSLINEDMPQGAIAVLGRGLGFIPTPSVIIEEISLDMRHTINRILSSSWSSLTDQPEPSPPTDKIPQKLSQKYYGLQKPAPDQAVNEVVDSMARDLDSRLKSQARDLDSQKKLKKPGNSNLSLEERKGLKWLEDMITKNKLSVVSADKGGATLIVHPELLRRKVLEKLNNPDLYTKLRTDPTQDLHRELFKLWVTGKENGFITPVTAKKLWECQTTLAKTD